MKKVGICVNKEKDTDFSVTNSIIDILSKFNVECEIAKECINYDFVISLGGDGTFLATARKFYESPIVGINLGNLGFLSEIDKRDMEVELKKILDGKFSLEERFLLEADIGSNKILALNDVVINRGSGTRLLNSKLYLDGKFVDTYKSDGLIISTPTGSTAYSLSAGGPIVVPDLDVIIISPICAHSLHQRPIIISSLTEVKVISELNSFMAMADGQEINNGDNLNEIIIKKSDKKVKIIKTTGSCFFDTLRNKFHIN